MRFSSLFSHSVSNAVRALEGGRSSRRRRPQVSLEMLEARELKAGGVTLAYGMLTIEATRTSGNVAVVAIDKANPNLVDVTLNGTTTQFNASLVQALTYNGGAGGGDTFSNNTAIYGMENGWGGNNTFNGGSGMDIFFVCGNGNTMNAGSGFEVVYAFDGGNTVNGGSGTSNVVVSGSGNTLNGGCGTDIFVVCGDGNAIHHCTDNDVVVDYGLGNTVTVN